MKSSKTSQEKWATLNMFLTMVAFVAIVVALSIAYFHENPSNITISTFFNLSAFCSYNLYLLFTALLAVLPFGGPKVQRYPNRQEYDYLTGGLTLILCLAVLFGSEVFGVSIIDYVNRNLFDLTMASLTSGLLLTVYIHLRSYALPDGKINPKVLGKNQIQSLFVGREIRPRFFGVLDLKVYVNRIAILSMVLLDSVFLYKSLAHSPNDLHKTLFVLGIIKLIYFIDGLFMEYTYEKSFEVQQNGFGFGIGVGNFVYPFLIAIFTKHIAENRIEFETWRLILICFVFIVGYLIYRISNNQKYNFRTNPNMQGVKAIPTGIKDKKILCSGLWGFVRHPNYLGDIMVQTSFTGFILCVPAFMLYFDILFMLDRSARDNENCKEKYGSVWDQYCQRVKYILVPWIY